MSVKSETREAASLATTPDPELADKISLREAAAIVLKDDILKQDMFKRWFGAVDRVTVDGPIDDLDEAEGVAPLVARIVLSGSRLSAALPISVAWKRSKRGRIKVRDVTPHTYAFNGL